MQAPGIVDSPDMMKGETEQDPTVVLRARTSSSDPDPLPSPSPMPGGYVDLGPSARGAFGEVRRVRDTTFDRVLAMKLLLPSVAGIPSVRQRFLTEVRVTASLQHPGIVPVYDHGELRDGRLWYIMKEVRGATLGSVLRELHHGESSSTWTFRRVLHAFVQVAQTMAYAHRHGVVHRDLKPENVMIGEFGEVMVMDWGLARQVTEPEPEPTAEEIEGIDAPAGARLTRQGEVLGTPAYMSPEQAFGARNLHGPASDVYALGSILYHLLAERPPFHGDDALEQLRHSVPMPVEEARVEGVVPPDLARLCRRAMERDPADRGTAEQLATDLLAWLDGLWRQEQALEVLARARALEPEIARVRHEAERALADERRARAALRPFDGVEIKRPAWALEDEAVRLAAELTRIETQWLKEIHGALSLNPELTEAHAALAAHYRAALVEAERSRRSADAARFETMLVAHQRGEHEAFLRAEGALTLVTTPAGADVIVERYEERDRRLVATDARVLGVTPLRDVSLRAGAYLLRVRAHGYAEMHYPVLLERGGVWDGCAPGEREPWAVPLLRETEIGPDEAYVPGSWAWLGGDPSAPDALPRQRVWIDGFVMQRDPVTVGAYLAFLNDLVDTGREADALAVCPCEKLGDVGPGKDLVFARDAVGHFSPPDVDEAGLWRAEMPMVQIDWHAATAFARWHAARTKRPWRLPTEIEREKAARGTDGRAWPWGDHGDATFTCVLETHRNEPRQEPVGQRETDESPYGVRGLAGNVRDWCSNVWRFDGPRVEGDRARDDQAGDDDPDFRAIRGGFWGGPLAGSRAAARYGSRPGIHRSSVGVRLVRSVGAAST